MTTLLFLFNTHLVSSGKSSVSSENTNSASPGHFPSGCGAAVGLVGALVGFVGALVGFVGAFVGFVGALVGFVGALVGFVGALLGFVGALVGFVGALVGFVGALVGFAGALVGCGARVGFDSGVGVGGKEGRGASTTACVSCWAAVSEFKSVFVKTATNIPAFGRMTMFV